MSVGSPACALSVVEPSVPENRFSKGQPMMRVARPTTMSNRTLNRLIVALVAILVVGGLAITALYVSDRWMPHGTTVVDRQTAALEAAVRKEPNNVNARLQLAGAYTAAKRYQDAIDQFNAVLSVQPAYKSALLGRGEAYQAAGTLDKASADFQAVIDMAKGAEFAAEDTELAQAYYSLGAVLIAQDKASEAISPLLAALANNNTDSDTLFLLGEAYVATNQSSKAIEALRGAVSFVPTGWSDPYTTLAKAYTSAGQADEA
jgi:tetratricopeptide (TPR) repeat protein